MTGTAKTTKWCLVRMSLLLLPAVVNAQEPDVARRSYPFLDDRLVVQVAAEAPGVLRVVRGERGKVEVAGRAADGFVGFGLGGQQTRQLRLTSVGGAHVEYLVVVPEHVRLTVQLPERGGSDLGPSQATALFEWGGVERSAGTLMPAAGGLHVAHSSRWTPPAVDLTDLRAVRSLSVRFEGAEFRIATSRPLTLAAGTRTDVLALAITGDPTDIVVYVPRGVSTFALRADGQRLLNVAGGQPTTACSGVAVQRPTEHQVWVTFYPRAGRLECR